MIPLRIVTLTDITSDVPDRDKSRKECMAALFLTDPRDDRERLKDLKGSIVDGTCEWVERHAFYRSWLHADSQLLWLSGGPGKGKTMISMFLAERLETHAKQYKTATFLQYFCDNKVEKCRTATAVLRGLLYQILQKRVEMFEYILPEFDIQRGSLFKPSSFQTLWRIFETMLRDPGLGSVCCVLDGLDECEKDSLSLLLKKIPRLFESRRAESPAVHLKLLITSRDFPVTISEVLSCFPRIDLSSTADIDINMDIQRFINIKVDELSSLKQYSENLRSHVRKVFRGRAQGTFLWVGIVANILKQYSKTEVEKALKLYPPGLDEVYARILLQVRHDHREIVARLLRWITMAIRPLTLLDLDIAVGHSNDGSSKLVFNREDIIRDQLSYCEGLVTVTGDVVGLIHQSAKDYLTRKTSDPNSKLEFFRVKAESTHLEIFTRCIKYFETDVPRIWKRMRIARGVEEFKKMMSYANEERYYPYSSHVEDDVLEYSITLPFLAYAITYWSVHADLLPAEAFDLSSTCFCDESERRHTWLEIRKCWSQSILFMRSTYGHSFDADSFDLEYVGKEHLVRPTVLHIASYFGILPLAKSIIASKGSGRARSSYVNKEDESNNIALFYAVHCGHAAIVRLLLANGSKVETWKREGPPHRGAMVPTIIHEAIRRGDTRIVQYLLESGANVNPTLSPKNRDHPFEGWTPLFTAIFQANPPMVSFLLRNGANIHTTDSSGQTTLHVLGVSILSRSCSDVHAIISMLLDKGAKIEARDHRGRTALHCATTNGLVNLTRVLLDEGANIEAQDEDNCTPLHLAVRFEKKPPVRMLLDKGGNIKAENKEKQTALHKLAVSYNESLTRMLLDVETDIETHDESGQTVLRVSGGSRSESTVRLLLDRGANINAKDNDGRTALHMTSVSGFCLHVDMVLLLLKGGIDPAARDNSGRTALDLVNEELVNSLQSVEGVKDYEGYSAKQQLEKQQVLFERLEKQVLFEIQRLLTDWPCPRDLNK